MKGYFQLTQRQRSIIEDLYALGKSCRAIARELVVHSSTISRELRRNGNRRNGYKADGAESWLEP